MIAPKEFPLFTVQRQYWARPKSYIVIAILLLVFALYALNSLFGNIDELIVKAAPPPMTWVIGFSGKWICEIFAFIMSIGLLTMKPWARKGTIIWIICSSLFVLTYTAVVLGMQGESDLIPDLMVVSFFELAFTALVVYCLSRPDVVAKYAVQQRKYGAMGNCVGNS